MKKLSTIIALALIVTIGGVYAAWNYAQGAAAGAEVTREINMAQVVTKSEKGTIAVTPNNFAFLVDDVDAKDYIAALTATGSLQVNFSANPGSDASLATTGISMIATVAVKYTGDKAPTYTGVNANDQEITVIPVRTKEGANTFAISGKGVASNPSVITAEQILGTLEFCTDTTTGEVASLKLPTKASNDAFHGVLKNYTIYITISEVVA